MKIGILWDLDGTLLDTLDDLTDGTNYVMRQFGYPQHSKDAVRRFVGNGARKLMEHAVPEGKDVDKALAAFQTYYSAHCQIKTAPYPGILEALKSLGEKYPMAVVSNKPDVAVKPLCAQYFPNLYARGESADCPRKPAPDMVYKAMEAIGVEKCIYVGDSEVDVLTAKNAGVPALSVLWGFRDQQDMLEVGGIHFCDDPAKLESAIAEIAKNM